MTVRVPDVGTVDPAVGATGIVGPPVIVRHAGLPAAAVDDLAAPVTTAALDAADRAEATARESAGEVSDALYRAVPGLADKPARRAAVALRRDVHNGRWSERTARHVATVAPHLDADVARTLETWSGAVRDAERYRAAARESIVDETARAARAMHGHLTGGLLLSGLALASPDFTDRLLAGPLPAAPNTREARSATAYLTRTALKTSPFSSLTTVGVVPFGSGGVPDSGGAGPGGAAVSSARPLAVSLLMACARTPGLAERLDVVPAPSTRRVDGRLMVVLPTRAVVGGTAFRQDDLVVCDRAADVLDLPRSWPAPFEELLAQAGSEGERARLRRLLAAGLLQPVLPWELDGARDFAVLAGWIRRNADMAPTDLIAAVDRLATAEAVVGADDHAGDTAVRRRTGALRAARAAAGEAFVALGRPVPPWVADIPLFHEVVATQAAATPLPEGVRTDLAATAAELAPLTWRHPVHDELVRCFVARHGVGASGVDLIGFLYAFLAGADAGALVGLAPRVDRATGRDPRRLRGDATMAPASQAVFFQVERPDDPEDPDAEHTTVINAVHPGGLGMLARWAVVPSLHDVLADPLTAWATALHPGCRVLQLASAADWTDLQRPALRTLPVLRAPGDLRSSGEPVEPAGLTLTHRPATGSLQVLDPDGRPVAFAYVGAVPQHLLQGVVRLLALLSDPWLVLGRVGRDRRVFDDPTGPDGGSQDDGSVVARPRIVRGKVVWARARWSFPSAAVPQPVPGASAVEHVAEVRRWARRHGLPVESFVSAVRRHRGRVTTDKPQWMGLDHPHTVWAALGKLRPEVSTVDVTEVLPARAGHLAPVVAEYLGLVRHG